MGPDLWELFEDGKEDDEIGAIIRLGHYSSVPAGVRVISQFGDIITVRLKRGNLPNVSGAPEVAGMVAGDSYLGPDVEEETEAAAETDEAPQPTDERRPRNETATGRGIIIGVVDWGFDFAHPDFRNPNGTTRIIALWDQRGGKRSDSPQPFGYGILHDRNAINKALREKDPYKALGYHPADADSGIGSHGTHVASIAGGSGGNTRPVGIAPSCDFVFVHNAPWSEADAGKLGDSVTLLEGIDFIARIAADPTNASRKLKTESEASELTQATANERPWVINLSMGRHGEQHDGSTLIELGLDAAIRAAPGRAVCMSAGNYFDKRIHVSGQLRPTEKRSFVWEINQANRLTDYNELEIWYSWQDKFEVSVRSPDGATAARVKLNERAKLMVGGTEVGNVYHRGQEPQNLDNHINFFLYKQAPAGPWEVTLIGEDVIDGRFHAWIERDVSCPKCQSHFRKEDADPRSTTGTICNGRRTIAVGAYDAHEKEPKLGRFSSMGPTRDGRLKPDLCAPGVAVLAARSAPRDKKDPPLLTRMSGTSMAAPHVTGTVALLFEAAPRRLRIEETHNLLLEHTERVTVANEIPERVGIGFLDIEAAVAAARKLPAPTGFKQAVIQVPASGSRPPTPAPKQSEQTEQSLKPDVETEVDTDAETETAPETNTEAAETVEVQMPAAPESRQTKTKECCCNKHDDDAAKEASTKESEQDRGEQTETEQSESEAAFYDSELVEQELRLLDQQESEAEAEFHESEADLEMQEAQSCSDVSVDCIFPPPADLKKIRPKGTLEGDFIERTQGDPTVNLALQLVDYDVNAYIPMKARHVEALGRIRDFIVQRTVQSSQPIAVTVTGSASRTGGKDYNDILSCKRARCAADNLQKSLEFFRGVAQRVQINSAGEGFERATCQGSDCELDEWRSVLIQVHAPGDPPNPIPVVDPGWDKYTIRCCSFHTDGIITALLSDLLTAAGIDKLPEPIRKKIPDLIKKGVSKIIARILKALPKLKVLVNEVSEFLKYFPAEIIRETGVFEIKERDKANPRALVLCYSGYGLRISLPRKNIDEFLDETLDKIPGTKLWPDALKKEFKEKVKSLIPNLLKTAIQPIQGDTPGPLARFDLRHPRKIGVFAGRVQVGKAFWMPGQVNVEFASKPWTQPDPSKRPAIVACPDTDCNESGVQCIVGDGLGLEFFSITEGDLVAGPCLCAPAEPPVKQQVPAQQEQEQEQETEIVPAFSSELVEVAETAVNRAEGAAAESVLHELWEHTGAAEALLASGREKLPSAAEVFDCFSYSCRPDLRAELEQYFEVVARPRETLEQELQEADLLVRRTDGETAHVAVIAAPQLRDAEALRVNGLTPEVFGAGEFVQVIEAGARPHSRSDNFARRVTEATGRLPQDSMVLRLRGNGGSRRNTQSDLADYIAELYVESGPGATCPPFLSGVSSTDYLRYIEPETTALVKPLINGRSSGGTGPDIDLTEPLDEMQKLVKSLGSGDSVYLSAWFFEPATALTLGSYGTAKTWGAFFALKAQEGVKIRIILNDFDPISQLDTWLNGASIAPLDAIIKAIPTAHRDNLKYIVSLHPATVGSLKSRLAGQGGRPIHIGSHHQKFMVVHHGEEITAFCGGLDIESRKTPKLWDYAGLIGWHDLHVAIQGPATRGFEREFVERWNREKGSSARASLAGWKPFETLTQTPLTKADNTAAKKVHRVQMIRTVSVDATLSPYSTERDDIKRVYEMAIGCATSYIYLENQYFRSTDMADWIVKQGKANPKLIVIIVVLATAAADDGDNAITQHGDFLQHETFDRIMKGLGSRARLYTMKNRAVHSKFVMTDDKWMTIGSANANERSFTLDSELNLSIADGDLVTGFRKRLWAHNLGTTSGAVAGWKVADFIPKWDAVAKTNALLSAQDMAGEGVIPFDYKSSKGKKHGSLPDALTKLDLAPEGRIFAGPLAKDEKTIRLA